MEKVKISTIGQGQQKYSNSDPQCSNQRKYQNSNRVVNLLGEEDKHYDSVNEYTTNNYLANAQKDDGDAKDAPLLHVAVLYNGKCDAAKWIIINCSHLEAQKI